MNHIVRLQGPLRSASIWTDALVSQTGLTKYDAKNLECQLRNCELPSFHIRVLESVKRRSWRELRSSRLEEPDRSWAATQGLRQQAVGEKGVFQALSSISLLLRLRALSFSPSAARFFHDRHSRRCQGHDLVRAWCRDRSSSMERRQCLSPSSDHWERCHQGW